MDRSFTRSLFLLLVALVAANQAIYAAEESAHQYKLVIDYGDGSERHFTALPWKEGLTVLEATKIAEKHPRGISTKIRGSGSTAFLTQIDDVANEGNGRNWVFRVNGKLGDRSSGIYKIDDGDTILWRFQKYE